MSDYVINEIAPGVYVHKSSRDYEYPCGCMEIHVPGEPHIPGMFEPRPDCPEHGDPDVLRQLGIEVPDERA